METLTIKIKNKNALAILKGLEKAGLIAFSKIKDSKKNLSEQLRGTISSSRATEMMKFIEKEREEWENRY